jgi:putative glycosyltransferase (TIGR04372 family)
MIFSERQLDVINKGGIIVVIDKIKNKISQFCFLPLYILAIPIVIVIRLIKPLILIRFGVLNCGRIGHFAANTEEYLCAKDAGIRLHKGKIIDFFYLQRGTISNNQLARMWRREIIILPFWVLFPIYKVNRIFPGWKIHWIDFIVKNSRDIYNLLDISKPHLKFTADEELEGIKGLNKMGILDNSPFVCLFVRDNEYLSKQHPNRDWSYHNYRDNDIQNYVLAAEELADRGYFVIRMGAIVREAIKSNHQRVIDYAAKGMRSDFMDIYLGAKCEFCISTGAGWDAVPSWLFRKPIVYTNLLPLGYLPTSSSKFILLTKRHWNQQKGYELKLSEIFIHGLGFCLSSTEYENNNIKLIENTPEEIRDVVIEMDDKIKGVWQYTDQDKILQQRFWDNFHQGIITTNKQHLHGKYLANFSTSYLQQNQQWLD